MKALYPTFWHSPRMMQERLGDQMWWSIRRCIEAQVKEFQPDAILSYWAHPEGEVGVRTAQLAGVPSAVIVGGSDVLILPQLPGRGDRVRDVLIQSDAVITVSNGLRDSVIDLGVNPNHVKTIYQGVDPTVFNRHQTRIQAQQKLQIASERKHLLWVGRMVPVKALDVLIDAMLTLKQNLRPSGIPAGVPHLHLVGDGPERSRLKQRVDELDLTDSVTFEGAIGHDQITDWYRAADLTVLSSDSEGLPNVLRESLACGTPFVSTDVGSIREISDPAYSLLVAPQNPIAFAKAIVMALGSNISANAAEYQPRTWHMTAHQTATLFDSLHRQQIPSTLPIKDYRSQVEDKTTEASGTHP